MQYFKKIKYNSLIIRKFNQLRIIHCYSIFLEVLKKYNDSRKRYTFIEPSAGSGSFLKILPKNKRIGIDIEPRFDEIIKQDYLFE